ncbi:MXAN_6230/SCO0854 family RING domain-containing protein [Streptomyces sp. NBC_00347]|uniref:MXAN_6230/SCO0854 family RING domain-containing protein n=1 Tax=Streptomyces sp. NBC_00347 TaxID=2975721 RepID=UPI002B1E8B5C|nr:MXAN_6230/SCO0854 family RING domain-containing protein [Streptomyces sp. NBC_00347]
MPVTRSTEELMLRRLRTVYLDRPSAAASPGTEGVRPLEGELLERGHTVSRELYAALAVLAPTDLAEERSRLLALADGLADAGQGPRPAFRRFPFSIPRDTEHWYTDRVLTLLRRDPVRPCALCAGTRPVRSLAPCAHLVCGSCRDGADHGACPVCLHPVDPAGPFLSVSTEVPPSTEHRAPDSDGAGIPPGPLRLLRLGTDPAADAARVLAPLLARSAPLSPEDRADLPLLLRLAPAGFDWLPARIPVPQTLALVLAGLLTGPAPREAVLPLLAGRLTSATDVLRLLAALSGGDPGLLAPASARFRSPARPLRRALLGVLDALPAPGLVEELLRYPTAWKRAAETLHPFERYASSPRAAMAFAVLRGTVLSGALGAALRECAAAHPDAVRVEGNRLRPATWAGRLEQALAGADPAAAAAVAGDRPEELVLRLDHLLRLHTGDRLVPELARELARALPAVGAGPLLAALGALRGRVPERTGSRRVFFPKGPAGHIRSVTEDRPPLPVPLVREASALLEAEVVRRFARTEREPYELAVLDSGLAELPVPSGEQARAGAPVAVPRGSFLALPAGRELRLFLHWSEARNQVAHLDLAVAFFDADWKFTGLCDRDRPVYGRPGAGAVHAGGHGWAPVPVAAREGETEYVDLDPAGLAERGDAYAVALVSGYSGVPFEELARACTGFAARPSDDPRASPDGSRASPGDPSTAGRRFDLSGPATRARVPVVVDLAARRALWADLHLPPSGDFESVTPRADRVAAVASDTWAHFASGTRTTLWDLTVWRAAARTREVAVIRRATESSATDEVWLYRAADGEEPAVFAARIAALEQPEERRPRADADAEAAELAAGKRAFLALTCASVAPEGGSGTACRLFPGPAEVPGSFARVTAGDLVAELA